MKNFDEIFLKDEIKKYCDGNGKYIPNEWNEESLTKEILADNSARFIETVTELEDYIMDNYSNDIEDEFREKILDDYGKFLYQYSLYNSDKPFTDDEIEDLKIKLEYQMWEEYSDSKNVLYETGYSGEFHLDYNKIFSQIHENIKEKDESKQFLDDLCELTNATFEQTSNTEGLFTLNNNDKIRVDFSSIDKIENSIKSNSFNDYITNIDLLKSFNNLKNEVYDIEIDTHLDIGDFESYNERLYDFDEKNKINDFLENIKSKKPYINIENSEANKNILNFKILSAVNKSDEIYSFSVDSKEAENLPQLIHNIEREYNKIVEQEDDLIYEEAKKIGTREWIEEKDVENASMRIANVKSELKELIETGKEEEKLINLRYDRIANKVMEANFPNLSEVIATKEKQEYLSTLPLRIPYR